MSLADRAQALREALHRPELDAEHRPILEGQLFLVEKQLAAREEKKRQHRDIASIEAQLKRVSCVEIAEGTFKFAYIRVQLTGSSSVFWFVRSHPYAKYHYMAIQDLIDFFSSELGLDEDDYTVPGGGRLTKDAEKKYINVYGYSNQFGQGDNRFVASLIREDKRYADWDVEWSLEGY